MGSPRSLRAISALLNSRRKALISCSASSWLLARGVILTYLCVLEPLGLFAALVDVNLDLRLRLFQGALAPSKLCHFVGNALDSILVDLTLTRHALGRRTCHAQGRGRVVGQRIGRDLHITLAVPRLDRS
jgi:hypothetical protein